MPASKDDYGPVGLAGMAEAWEMCHSVRSRFRRSFAWLQYPIPGSVTAKKEDEEAADKSHSPSTRALELNHEILGAMLDIYDGEFIDVHRLTREAGFQYIKVALLL